MQQRSKAIKQQVGYARQLDVRERSIRRGVDRRDVLLHSGVEHNGNEGEPEFILTMKQIESLTEKNWLIYAAKHYDNPSCYDQSEFMEDVRRLKYIKKALTRYETTGELKERLILNHIIVLTNVFGHEATVRLLFLKMEGYMKYLKPFLILLSIMPDIVYGIGKEDRVIYTDEIEMDMNIVEVVRKI